MNSHRHQKNNRYGGIFIGDYITLSVKLNDSFLCSDGLLGDNCYLTANKDKFDDCLWEVHIQNQYGAMREYKDAVVINDTLIENLNNSDDLSLTERTEIKVLLKKSNDSLKHLKKAALSEIKLNRKLMSIKHGRPLAFGDTFQLCHVKSRKFLTVSSNILAKEERENMKVTVEAGGDSLSCVSFMPRFKYDREGSLMSNNVEAVIKVHERPGEFIHAATKQILELSNAEEEGDAEVNCSLESSFWTVSVYQRSKDVKSKSIMAGQLVTFQDPDNLSCLTLDTQVPGITERARVIMSPQFQLAGGFSSETDVGTSLLWLVEKDVITSGGPISIRDDAVTLRDLNSGLYMKFEGDGLFAVRSRKEASHFEFHNSQAAAGTESSTLVEDTAIHISCNGSWVGCGADPSGGDKHVSLGCITTDGKADSLSLVVSANVYKSVGMNLHIGVYATISLRRFVAVTNDFLAGKAGILGTLASAARRFFLTANNLCTFLAGVDEDNKEELRAMLDPPSKETIKCRQNMMREQGLLDVLLDILDIAKTNVYDRVVVAKRRRSLMGLESTSGQGREKSTVNLRSDHADTSSVRGLRTAKQQAVETAPTLDASKQSTFDKFSKMVLGSGSRGNKALLSTRGGYGRLKSIHVPSDSEQPSGTQSPVGEIESELKVNAAQLRRFSNRLRSSSEAEEVHNVFPSPSYGSAGTFAGNGDSVSSHSQEIANMCLKVLLYTIVDNHANQLHIADRFPELLDQVKQQRLASLCVQEMLRDNLTILQTKVRQREISMLVKLLSETDMGVTYLKLLQSTCSCPMGVDATQRMVTYALFGSAMNEVKDEELSPERSPLVTSASTRTQGIRATLILKKMHNANEGNLDTKASFAAAVSTKSTTMTAFSTKLEKSVSTSFVLKIVPDWSKRRIVSWTENCIYVPRVDVGREILGLSLVTLGLPTLSLFWLIGGRNGDFSMAQLFGYSESVPIAVICNAVNSAQSKFFADNLSSKSHKSGRKTGAGVARKRVNKISGNQTILNIAQNKAHVAEYLITQLYLVADLCLDRNYVAINILENLYEYDVLITMLKSEDIPTRFKAPVCRILRCLYVDKEPQVATKFPRYIRTSVSLGGGDESFQSRKDFKTEKFALIQQIISTYIRTSLSSQHCDEMSTEMLALLEALVEFGFYSTPLHIRDILEPLIQLLDDHRVSREVLPVVQSKQDSFLKKGSLATPPQQKSRLSKLLGRDHIDKREITEAPTAVSKKKKVMWESQWLTFTESIWGMTIIISVVMTCVIMAIVQLSSSLEVAGFDIFTMIFFLFEILLRIYCYWRVNKVVFKFFRDFFNIIDALLVALDLVLLGFSGGTHYVNVIRAVRALRVFRLVRAVHLIRRVVDGSAETDTWTIPERYNSLTEFEAPTLIHALKILSMIYDRIQDEKLDLTIKAFSLWCNDARKKIKRDPVDVYNKVLLTEENMSADITEKFDSVLLDIMMYEDADLVQESLNLLMVHKSQQELFFDTAENIQIIYSARVETVCGETTKLLRNLKRLAEMYEIWSEMETDEDRASATEVMDILRTLKMYLTKPNDDKTLCIRRLLLVDEEVQNLLRNLDAMSCFMALMESLFDGGREELKPAIVGIMRQCSELICWFVKDSVANQAAAFKHIEWFVDRVDDGVNSSLVLRAIIEGNRDLIKQCPRQYISDFAHKILTNGRRPEYLDMFVGMTEFSDLMDSRVPAVESDISSYLTSREWKKHVLLWCCAPESKGYEERREAMGKFVNSSPPCTVEDLSPELQYHARLLTLFAECNLGPKLQAIYPIHDVISAILDTSTIPPVRHALGRVLIETLKTAVDRVEKSELFWKLLVDIAEMFETMNSDMKKLMISHPLNRAQTGEWAEICISIVVVFFDNFELASFNESKQFDRSSKSPTVDAKVLIQRLIAVLKLLGDNHVTRLGNALAQQVSLTVLLLNTHISAAAAAAHQRNQEEDEEEIDDKLKSVRSRHKRDSVVFADVQQLYYRKQFKVFMASIKESVQNSAVNNVVKVFERIPSVKDIQIDSDLRFEPLVDKLSSHLRSMITRTPLHRSMGEAVSNATIRLLKTYRNIFESKLRFSMNDRVVVSVDDANESPAVASLRLVYNDFGLVNLCLDLVSVGIDRELYIEALKILVILMLKNGGCREVQRTVHKYLLETDSVLLFELLSDMIDSLKTWCGKHFEAEKSSPENHAVLLPEDMIALSFIQLSCEGDFALNKDQFRDQLGNSKQIDILESLAVFVGALSRNGDETTANAASYTLRTILRLVQGPCKGNQEQFVLHTELLSSLNRIIRTPRPMMIECLKWLYTLKEALIDVLRGLIEGQPKSSLVFERVTTTVDLSVLNMWILPNDRDLRFIETSIDLFGSRISHLQAKYLVFVQTLGVSRGNIQGVTSEELAENVASVEVIWNHEVHTVYFHIPEFISDLTMESRLKVEDSVLDCATQELKLVDFVRQSRVLFRESMHQQFLKQYNLAGIWKSKGALTRIMFVNAVLMNVLLVAFYRLKEPEGHEAAAVSSTHRELSGGAIVFRTSRTALPYMPEDVEITLMVLNGFHILLAIATLSIFLIVQVPVTFSSYRENNKTSVFMSMIYTAMDPLPLWYTIYLGVTIAGETESRLFLSLLLLDWVVLDDTTRDLLLAVILPARQLAATLILILISLNIFACVNFALYRQDIISDYNIADSWEMLKLIISYGFRGEYGIDHEMSKTTGPRLWADVAFYICILAILREVFFAIIIDTFDEMREHAYEREKEANNCCFICGIERHDYDKVTTPGISKGFSHHREKTHNTLNYLYFILSIWHQSQQADNGIEIYVRSCLSSSDVSWFPIGVVTEAAVIAHGESVHGEEEHSNAIVKHGNGGHHGGGGHGGGHGKKHHGNSHGESVVATQPSSTSFVTTEFEVQMLEKLTHMQHQISKITKYLNENPITSDQVTVAPLPDYRPFQFALPYGVTKDECMYLMQRMLDLGKIMHSVLARLDAIEDKMRREGRNVGGGAGAHHRVLELLPNIGPTTSTTAEPRDSPDSNTTTSTSSPRNTALPRPADSPPQFINNVTASPSTPQHTPELRKSILKKSFPLRAATPEEELLRSTNSTPDNIGRQRTSSVGKSVGFT